MHSYLKKVFQLIVRPFISALRQIMLCFGFSNEACLYASDLRFKLCEDTVKGFHGSEAMKHEDAMVSLREKLGRSRSRFRNRFDDMQKEAEEKGDPDARVNLAVALYLATYFDANTSCREYYNLY